MNNTFPARLIDIPRLPYVQGLGLMRELVARKRRGEDWETLILTEHEPVLTMGLRGKDTDILVSPTVLAKRGISVHRIERGGLVTYHGPGQLMAYPVFDLKKMDLCVPDFVRNLEKVLLETLDQFQIGGRTEKGYPGVWVGEEKIASIGLALRSGVTFHGISLNYGVDPDAFCIIHPCGLEGVKMTSMECILGNPVDPTRLRKTVAGCFKDRFQLEYAKVDFQLPEWFCGQNKDITL